MASTPKSVRKTRAMGMKVAKVAGTKKEPGAYAKFEKASDKMYKGAPKKPSSSKDAPKSSGPKSKGAY